MNKFAGKYASAGFVPRNEAKTPVVLDAPPRAGSSTRHIPSLSTAGHSTAPIERRYTGNAILGIATMHKSNAVPVFTDAEAKDLATMRRN